jgi:hypothetical protein
MGMVIAFISGGISGALTTAAGLIESYLSNQQFNVPDIILWPITGTVVFSLLFVIFNRFIWRLAKLRQAVGIPNLEGKWEVSGRSYDAENNPKYLWSGVIDITQCYEKITVHLRTRQSASKSISAAIINEGRVGHRLIYSYRNQPDAGEKELAPHLGHCELLFDAQLTSARGNYFNGGGRFTHGTMELRKVES